MSRLLTAFDRLAALVAGLVLVCAGAALLAWRLGWLPSAPVRIASPWMAQTVTAAWWPWTLVGAGVVLLLVGFRWLFAHLPTNRVRRLTLRGSSSRGRLTVDASQVLGAIADDLQDHPDVRTSRGKVTNERGRIVAVVAVVVDPDTDVETVIGLGEAAGTSLVRMTGCQDVAYRMQVSVAPRTIATGRSRVV